MTVVHVACRPAYLGLGSLRASFPCVPIIAVTATATPAVQDCIKASLGMRECILLKESFNRRNLYFEVRQKELIGNGTEEDATQVLQSIGLLTYRSMGLQDCIRWKMVKERGRDPNNGVLEPLIRNVMKHGRILKLVLYIKDSHNTPTPHLEAIIKERDICRLGKRCFRS